MNIRKILPAAIAAMALSVPSFAIADTETVGGIEWTYSLSNGEAAIGTGEWADNAMPRDTSGDIVVPSTLGGCPVTAIGECAFYNCYSITSVTIPDGVTSIGRNAFSQCYRLASVTFPESLTSIGGWAFEYSPIKTVSIPASVSSIGEAAFYRCTSLTEIDVSPDNRVYKSIGGVLFDASQKTLLAYPAGKDGASYEIPAGVETIGYEAFHHSSLASILVPDSVRTLSAGAFSSSQKLESIHIPASVSSIGDGVFWSALNLREITVDPNNEYFRIENGALVEADTLKFFPLGNGVVSYTIPDGITKIDHRAFYGHQTLESVVISESVTSLGYIAFDWCPNLKNVEIRGGITSCEWHVFRSNSELTNVVISSGTTVLGGGMFEDCSKLETITIPDSVTRVRDSIFSGCSGLTSISIPYAINEDVSDWGLPETCEIVVRDKIPLAITTDATLPDALTDVSYWQPLAAAGGLLPYTWEIVDADDWPTWLDSGYINYWDDWDYDAPYLSSDGDPGEDEIGTYTFAIRVTDAEGTSVEKTFTLEVKENPNKRPVIDTQTPSAYNLTVASGETVTLSISAHDPNGDALSYRWYGNGYDENGNYYGLGLVGSGDSFDFSRPVGGEGTFDVGCEVSDGSISDYANWRISVRNIPVIDTAELPEATEGVAYETTLAAHGGTAPYAWALAPSDYAEQSQASTFAAVGDAQGWNDDDGCWTLDLPFAFPFYGGSYSTVRVSSNGFLDFGDEWNVWHPANASRPCVIVLGDDLRTDGGSSDIYVESDATHVTVRWNAAYYKDDSGVNASATLYPDGRIVLSYGAGNANGGFIGLSAGDGETQVVAAKSDSGSMSNAKDIVFVPAAPPAGMTVSADGVLSGTPDEPGEYVFTVAVTDDAGESSSKTFTLNVAENGALRPGLSSISPEAGYMNMGAETAQAFEVEATHPTGGDVEIEWFLDGESVGTGATYDYVRDDNALHAIRVVASAADLPKAAVREWQVGTLTISDPEPIAVSYGMNATLSVEVVSSLDATVTWFDADTDEELGTGGTLTLRNVTAERHVRAQASNAFGTVETDIATVSVDPTPAVGRIYKMTGSSFVGNRLVLRAKTYGDPTAATFAWKRDGVTVATTERLDIPALGAGDFGTYTFTMTNPHGSATTEAFVLAEAPRGVPYGWGASGHGRTTAPEGLTGVAQVASGMNFNIGLKTDGTVAAWGYNGHGGCDVPEGLADVSFVTAGGYNSQGAGFAVKTDGSVVAWGQPTEIHGYWDEYGHWESVYDDEGNWIDDRWVADGRRWYEYTNGWDTVSSMPAGLSDVVKVAVGGEFAIALKADGTVETWGLADDYSSWDWNNAVTDQMADVVDIAAGYDFAMVLLSDGTAFPLGRDFGVLGSDSLSFATFDDAIGVAATKNSWTKAGFGLMADGTISGWSLNDGWHNLADAPCAGATAVDGGQYHAMALDNGGNVFVWGGIWYDQDRIPAAVQGNAVGIAAGGYHCTAILPDIDGDSIADAEEVLLGRDPEVYEDFRRIAISGLLSISGSEPASNAVVRLYDASGALRAAARTDEKGAYAISGVIPGNYFLKIEAEGAVDIWQDGLRPSLDGQAPFAAVGGDRDDVDFDLDPGQAQALVQAVVVSVADDGDGEYDVEDPPADSTMVYLDMWPAEDVAGAKRHGLIDIGEVSASHANGLLSHMVTLRPSGDDTARPSPIALDGIECETVEARFPRNPETGSVTIVTEPTGAEVWIDYADESVGVTPLTVGNLAAASHALLIRKDGYLRPRPIHFSVEAEGTTEVSVPLAEETEPAMSVMVTSAIPGMNIYIDYLPSEKVTPDLVDGLDPASHAGSGWFSASHSVLLRHPALTPFAPRAVPEWEANPLTDEPVIPDEPPMLHIDAPNTYEWDASERADFGVTLKEVPDLLYGGGTATVRWAVTNAGAVAATAPWKESVLLVNDAGLTKVKEVEISEALDAGDSAARSITFDVPADLARFGNARLRVEIDPENAVLQVRGGLADSATSGAIPFALPDFGVTWTSVPEILPVGGTVELGWTVTNAGLGIATAPWMERVLLVNGAGETLLLEQNVVASLAAGASAVHTASASIPADLAVGGDARLSIEIDPDGAVLQARSGLFDTVSTGAIPFALPDLGVAWTVVPEVLPVGGTVELGWTVRNDGLATAAAPWVERVWLVDADGQSIVSVENDEGEEVPAPVVVTNAVADISVGGAVARALTLAIDPGWYVGTDVWFKVDIARETAPLQRDVAPDSATAETSSVFATPDLGVSWKLLPADEGGLLPLGGTVEFGWTVTNSGLAATYAPWTERVWLKNDAGEFPVYEATAEDALESGASAVRTTSATVPWAALLGGAMEIRVEIDREGVLIQDPDSLANEATAGGLDLASDGWKVVAHTGTISGNETWGADAVHIVSGTVTVASGARLTIDPGAIVKFLDGARLVVASGATCVANGAILTHIADDTVGGDTMGDGGASSPVAGAYTITGTVQMDETTEERWAPPVQTSGNLSGAQRWRGHNVYRVTGNLTLASGCTLTIDPGAIVKFDVGVSLTVNSGATLDAHGSRALPIVFTTVKDDSVGGDTNGDGNDSLLQPNDWKNVAIIGTAKFAHVDFRYGGGENDSLDSGMLVVRYGGSMTMDCCTIAHGFYDGVFSRGATEIANTAIYDCDRGVNSIGGTTTLRNCVIDRCRWGAMCEGGATILYNTIITRFYGSAQWPQGWGLAYWSGSLRAYNCCVWSDLSGSVISRSPYSTRTTGVIYQNPLFSDPDDGDFTLQAGSPCIDAGDSSCAPLRDAFGQPRMDVKSVADTGRPDADGICADIGIHEYPGVAAVPLPNLAVLSVTAPPSAKAGDVVTIEYVVTNRGTAAASASIRDTVRLKGDASVGGATVEAGTVAQSYDLPVGGAAVTVTARVTVPGVASGAWTFGVDVNLERDVYEQNLSDNRAWAAEATSVAADSLSMGVAEKLVPGGASVGYALDDLPFEGGAAIIRGANVASLSARGAIGSVPTTGGGTPGVVLPDDSQLVFFPARDEGRTAYLGIENGGLSAARISVEVVDASPRLLGVSPSRIANEGTAALTLYGVGLPEATGATLAGRAATALEPIGTAQLLATFTAEGLKTGPAAVAATVPCATAALDGAVEIYTTKMGPKLVAWLDMPSNVRDGRVFAASVCYRNDGDTAMLMPCFKVYRDQYDYNTLLGLERNETPAATALHLGGVSPTAPAGVLKPGEEGSVTFYFVPRGSYTIRLEHVLESASAASAFPAFGGPEGYFEAMSAAATRLALRGQRAYDLQKCVDFALKVRNGTPFAAATGRLLDAATAAPLAGVEIALVAADDESGLPGATAKTADDGSFVLDGLADGDYRWLLGNGATLDAASTNVVAVANQADLNGLEILAIPGGRISGHVVCADGVPVANGTVALLNANFAVAGVTETDAFGFFSFAELADGAWAVQSAPADGWCAALATNLVIAAGARTAETTLTPVRGAVLRGTVALADGSAVTNGVVQAISEEGVSYETSVEADGTWSIPGIPEGDWAVRHYAADLFSPDEDVELSAGDEVELALVSAERPLFFPTRSVGFGSLETTFVFADQARAGEITSWAWDFDSDGHPDSEEAQPTHKYENLGTNTVTLVFVENGETKTNVYENCVRIEKAVETLLKDNAILFGRNSGNLEAISMEPGRLVLSGDPETGTLAAGMAIMGKCGEDWFCRRIVSAEKVDGQWVLETEFADWSDIYAQYAFSGLFAMADEEPRRGHSVSRAAKKALPGENEFSIEGGLRATRSAHPNFSIEIVREMRDGRKYDSWAIVGGFVLEGSYSLEGSATYSRTDSDDLEIPFPTGAEEFGVTGKVTAELYTSGSASIKGSFGMSAGVRAGLRIGQETYEGGKRHWLPPLVFDPTYSEPTGDFEGSLSLETGFKAGIKLKFLETASVGVSINPYAKTTLSAATSSPASAELVAGVNLVGEANLIDWEFGWFKVKIGAEGTLEGPKATAFKWTGPDPDFSYSPQTCEKAPGTYSFRNDSKGDTVELFGRTKESWRPTGYEWRFGDGSESDAVNPSHTFQKEGSYQVSLKAKGHFITGPVRKKKTVKVGKPDDIPDDGSRRQDDSQYDYTRKSWDPNEMAGPKGQGADRLVAPGQWMDYTIYFENHEGEDVADAQEVCVTNALSAQLDWTTFEMGDVVFGADDRTIDGLRGKGGSSGEWSADVPLSNGSEIKVSAKLTFNADTGLAVWYLRIVDPNGKLGDWPEDNSGFLPSNDDTHRGEGHITYRVKVRGNAVPGDKISASATIVFDENPPIATDPAWWNTVAAPAVVAFNENGGNGTMAEVSIGYDGSVKLPANKFTRTDYSFAGWATSPNGAVEYANNWSGQLAVAWGETVTLYAKWTPKTYKVTFSANGGKGTMAAQRIARNAATKLLANAFKRSGYVFIGWAKTKTGAVAYGNAAAVKNLAAADKSVTLYAQWAVSKYSVKFNANGGALPKGKKMAAQTMTYGKAAALRKNVFTRSGYVFIGWATKKGGAVAYKNGQSVKNLRTDGKATTLYAVWAKKTYKVAFYANGGTGKMAVESFTYGKAKKLTANKFKAPKGKKFAGWATSAANAKKGKVAYKNAQAVKNLVTTGKTVKLYAVWK